MDKIPQAYFRIPEVLLLPKRKRMVDSLRAIHDDFAKTTGKTPRNQACEIRWTNFVRDDEGIFGQMPGFKNGPQAGRGFHKSDTRAIIWKGEQVCASFGFMDFLTALRAGVAKNDVRSVEHELATLFAGLAFSMWVELSSPSIVLLEELTTVAPTSDYYEYKVVNHHSVVLREWWNFKPPSSLTKAIEQVVPTVEVRAADGKPMHISTTTAIHALHLIALNEDNLYHDQYVGRPIRPIGSRSLTEDMNIGRINMGLTTARAFAHLAGKRLAFPPPGWDPDRVKREFPHVTHGFPPECWAKAAEKGGKPPNPGMTLAEFQASWPSVLE